MLKGTYKRKYHETTGNQATIKINFKKNPFA